MQHIQVSKTLRPPMKGCEYIASLVIDNGKGIEKREFYAPTPLEAFKRLGKRHNIFGIETRWTDGEVVEIDETGMVKI